MEPTPVNDEIMFISIIMMLIAIAIALLLFVVPSLINNFILYKKAGQIKWSALVPVWGSYVFAVISKRSMWVVWTYVLLSFLPAFNFFLPSIWSGYSLGISLLSFIINQILLILYIYILVGFAKQYKVNNINYVGYWLLYVFVPIVALFWTNKLEYIGDAKQNTPLGPLNTSGAPAQINGQDPFINK